MANIKQVAHLAELSVACVSKYLKDPDSVLPSSREKIEYAIKELNYVPSALARNLRTKRTGIVRIISHNITNPFFAELFEEIRSHLEQQGYISNLLSIDYMEEKNFTPRDFEQIDGVILCFIENEKTLASIGKALPAGLPAVNLHGYKSIPSATSIITDVKQGVFDAAQSLVTQGCKRVGYIGGEETSTISKLKFSGFLEAMNLAPDISRFLSCNHAFSMQEGYNAAKELCESADAPDAVICENDLFAAGAIHYLSDMGIKIPEKVQIIGFDDIPLASMFIPSISSVSIPTRKISIAACGELLNGIRKNPVRDHYFLPEVVLRDSS